MSTTAGVHHTGPNAVSSHRARLVPVLWHQLRSPLLVLSMVAAVASSFVGERSDAVIIGVIVAVSVGLGFVNEYRAEKAAEASTRVCSCTCCDPASPTLPGSTTRSIVGAPRPG